jgi:hypothetical protein
VTCDRSVILLSVSLRNKTDCLNFIDEHTRNIPEISNGLVVFSEEDH